MLPTLATLVLLTVCTVTTGADTLTHVDEYRYDLVRLEQDLWNTVIDEQSNSISSKSRPEVDLIRSYQLFGDAIDRVMPGDITDGVKPLEGVWIYARAYSELRGVYALYEAFRRFQRLQVDPGRVPNPKQAWTDLAETILTDAKSSIPSALAQINKLITEENLFQESLKEIVFKHCDLNQSPDQVLYNLYNSVAWTELKGYAMVQFSLQLFKLFNNKGNFTNQATLMRQKYQERATQTADAAKAAMEKASRHLWKCDPKFHVRDGTYTELTRLLQGYVENEIDLSNSQSCMKNCAYYDFAQNNGCYKNGYCSRQQKCRGKLMNCQYIDSDMWVCPADRTSGRRYEYIEYENGRVLGRKMGCYRGTTKVDSWWRYLFWHCSYCMCICDDPEDSDRYFNLRQYVTDTENNKVVTGMKFVKKNRIIHLQIQEGELLPYGKINTTTVRWRPLDNYKLHDRTVASGQDYHTMSWQKRDLDLDDVVLPAQHVLTGVRFRLVGTHLNLEIQATPFNYSTGTLVQPGLKSYWHSNDDEPIKRSKLRLVNPDVPTRSPQPSALDSTSGQYVEFTYSDLNRDASQTTLPFIDLQAVHSELAVPLSGAGIYHKGNRGFGGFIAPKLITYDYKRHIGVEFPPETQPDVPDMHELGFDEIIVN